MDFLILIKSMNHFQLKGCWLDIFIFYLISNRSFSKQIVETLNSSIWSRPALFAYVPQKGL